MFDYILYKIGEWIALTFPLKIAYKFAVVISDVNYLFAFRDRKAVAENLRVIFPEKPLSEIRRIRKRMFRNFAKYLVDFFRFSKVDLEYVSKNVNRSYLHYLDEALSRNKGVIVLSAHLGNWELGGALLGVLGYPLSVVALVHKSKKVNDFFDGHRNSKGVKVIPLGRAAGKCLTVIKEKQVIALVGDRDFQGNGVSVKFFGVDTVFPLGPAVFSQKTGALVVPGFMLRNPDDTFTFQVEPAFEPAVAGDKEKDIRAQVTEYAKLFERYIRAYPDQWYMFRRFWVS